MLRRNARFTGARKETERARQKTRSKDFLCKRDMEEIYSKPFRRTQMIGKAREEREIVREISL